MTPVDQTMTVAEHGTGNCLAATLASVLDVSIDEVPALVDEATWFEDMTGFMRRHGYEYVCYIDVRPDGSWPEIEQEEIDAFGGYILASGYTERVYPDGHERAGKPILHAVVMDWATKTVVHDPHPSKAGLTRFYDCMIFRKVQGMSNDGYAGCGHGHVYPNPNGMLARCGGPALCSKCAADLAHKEANRKMPALPTDDDLDDVELGPACSLTGEACESCQ